VLADPGHAKSEKDASPVRVLFVCSGSAADGLGHVVRTRTVANAMDRVADVEVVGIGGDSVSSLLEGARYPVQVVASIEDAAGFAARSLPDVVVFDMLRATPAQFDSIAAHSMTVSLSPIFDRLADVDVLFHRTTSVDPAWTALGDQPLLRAGLEYAPIDEDCHRISTSAYQATLARRRLSVAVSMGGTDAANNALRVVDVLRDCNSQLLLWVLLGEGYEHSYEDLVDRARGSRHEIILAKTNESMWHILSTCAVCVLAGGTTTYEAAYAGLPSINLVEMPERRFVLQELVDGGVSIAVGGAGDPYAELTGLVEHFDGHREELLKMHRNAKHLLGSKGATRIASEILALRRTIVPRRMTADTNHGPDHA